MRWWVDEENEWMDVGGAERGGCKGRVDGVSLDNIIGLREVLVPQRL